LATIQLISIIEWGTAWAVIAGLVIGWININQITRPIAKIVAFCEQLCKTNIANLENAIQTMTKGNLQVAVVTQTQPLKMQPSDEIGLITQHLNSILFASCETIEKFNNMQSVLKNVLAETDRLTQSAQDGKLHERGDTARFEGNYQKLIQDLNDTLNAVQYPLQETCSILERMAQCDLSACVQGNYNGDHAKIKQALNIAIDNLRNKLNQINTSTHHLSTAVEQISEGSQSLAENASQQALSLEKISSSLDEMASITQKNAENTDQARNLAAKAQKSAESGTEVMQRMIQTIGKIKTSSDATAKIVNTIDEIAFQTNLLALNAAVEAARAGEAGKGFAVVAEEVRNLAQQSAEAARNTAAMIEESVKNTDAGVKVTEDVAVILQEITQGSHKVSNLIAEIASANNEQSQGIKQINVTVNQLDNLTQQNAASAEEFAGAAEELTNQSGELQMFVQQFIVSEQKNAQPKQRLKPIQSEQINRDRHLAYNS
jgi:methyl-accepting chemotaxis protein